MCRCLLALSLAFSETQPTDALRSSTPLPQESVGQVSLSGLTPVCSMWTQTRGSVPLQSQTLPGSPSHNWAYTTQLGRGVDLLLHNPWKLTDVLSPFPLTIRYTTPKLPVILTYLGKLCSNWKYNYNPHSLGHWNTYKITNTDYSWRSYRDITTGVLSYNNNNKKSNKTPAKQHNSSNNEVSAKLFKIMILRKLH